MRLDWNAFFSAIVINLIAVAIASSIGLLIRQVFISKRKKKVLHWVLLIIAVISGFIVIYKIIQVYHGDFLSIMQFILILFALLIHWGAVSVAYFVTRMQYGRKFKVRGTSTSIDVRHLCSYPSDQTLNLNWETVTRGIKFLIEQIRPQKGGGASFCVGINNAGGAIASFLAGFLGNLDPLPVYVAIAKGDHGNFGDFRQSLPDKAKPTILIVDMQLRTGTSMRKVVDILTEKYGPETRILKAVLAVTSVHRSIKHIEEIKKGIAGEFEQANKYLPDYVAFVHENSSIRLPENIQ